MTVDVNSLYSKSTNKATERMNKHIIALAGNPNVGKSTIFNRLTGLKQHTGNWPGKTVIKAEGTFSYRNRQYTLVDLPGTYSLYANSSDEQIARDFICFSRPDIILVVCDATCLERNLNLLLQILEISSQVLLCVNLLDEAARNGMQIDMELLQQQLGIPVVGTAARSGRGLIDLKNTLDDMLKGRVVSQAVKPIYDPELEIYIKNIEERLMPFLPTWINSRWVALRMLEKDFSILEHLSSHKDNTLPRQILKKETALCLP